MAEVIVFHHAQGLTPGVVGFADELRRAGHVVHTPDLYGGRTFASLDAGVAFAESISFGTVIEQGARAVDGLADDLVYIGFSLGVLPAQQLAQTRPGTKGALLIHSCITVSEFGVPWPRAVPVQIHAKQSDPFFIESTDLEAARDLVARGDRAELFLYPGDQHLFADPSLDSYDPAAAALMNRRVGSFLAKI